MDSIIESLKQCKDYTTDGATQAVYKRVEEFITKPWERIVQRSPLRKPLWWNRRIGSEQQKRRYLARKWHKVKRDADRRKDTDLCKQDDELHEKVIQQQKAARRLSRQAQEQLAARTKVLLKEAGLTEQSRTIKKTAGARPCARRKRQEQGGS